MVFIVYRRLINTRFILYNILCLCSPLLCVCTLYRMSYGRLSAHVQRIDIQITFSSRLINYLWPRAMLYGTRSIRRGRILLQTNDGSKEVGVRWPIVFFFFFHTTLAIYWRGLLYDMIPSKFEFPDVIALKDQN